jgi:hypothetical protein
MALALSWPGSISKYRRIAGASIGTAYHAAYQSVMCRRRMAALKSLSKVFILHSAIRLCIDLYISHVVVADIYWLCLSVNYHIIRLCG